MAVRPGVLGWWSPRVRGILPLDGLHVSRSLRRVIPRFRVTIDTDFPAVIRGCAAVPRPGAWITPDIAEAYERLHDLGWAHSVEVRDADDALVGGLYGLAIGGLFAGESMFHLVTDASKVAMAALVECLGGSSAAREGRLVDVQWRTPHLGTMGVIEVSRREYRDLLDRALTLPPPVWRTPPNRVCQPGAMSQYPSIRG